MAQTGKFFAYKVRQTTYKVQVNDIVCLESYRRKMILHFADGRKEEFYGRVKDICQSSLMDNGFIHVHKSYIVNFNYIGTLKFPTLTLTNGTVLPVSVKRYRDVKAKFLGFFEA